MKKPSRYFPFKKAREYSRNLGLSTKDDWIAFIRGEIPELGKKPSRIPDLPQKIYSRHIWLGYEDWLRKPSNWRSFEEARKYARTLGLKSPGEWKKFVKGKLPALGIKPYDIPDSPARIYANNGWAGMPDWLGTKSHWRPFEEARKYSRGLGFKSMSEWNKFARGNCINLGSIPHDIPVKPDVVYRNLGWKDWLDWLDYSNSKWRPFEEAREFARYLGLKGWDEWRAYVRGLLKGRKPKPVDIPCIPESAYIHDGWTGYRDWLGSEKKCLPYNEARDFVRNLNLSSNADWRKYCAGAFPEKGQRPEYIPAVPEKYYLGKGWVSWGDFLGTRNESPHNRSFKPFKKARAFVRGLKLKNQKEWRLYVKESCPSDIPAAPCKIYKNSGWLSLGDWLGTGNLSKSKMIFKSYTEARAYVRSLNLKSQSEWKRYITFSLPKRGKRPKNIPSHPDDYYKNKGWISWSDWLGCQVNKFCEFEKARNFARSLKLRTVRDWKRYCNRRLKGFSKPADIPNDPSSAYKGKGWIDWYDWLGKDKP